MSRSCASRLRNRYVDAKLKEVKTLLGTGHVVVIPAGGMKLGEAKRFCDQHGATLTYPSEVGGGFAVICPDEDTASMLRLIL